MIKAWSMSRLDVYETCPYRAYLQYVQKIPTPELVPKEGQDEHALVRGLRVHTAAERFVIDDINLIDELQNFSDAFHLQRAKYRESPDLCAIEQEWAIDECWQQTGWSSDTAWGRMKLDYAELNPPEMTIVDYKTGKKYPVKHIQQGQLYALVSSIRYPEIEKFNVAFWYLDSGETLKQSYNRTQLEMFKEDFDRRARTMTTATEFPPKSSAYACRFCPYGEGYDGNKYCEYRYSFEN
jgi:CRISPR/Cas system-associated exonuclease Cas4 (RecB family)